MLVKKIDQKPKWFYEQYTAFNASNHFSSRSLVSSRSLDRFIGNKEISPLSKRPYVLTNLLKFCIFIGSEYTKKITSSNVISSLISLNEMLEDISKSEPASSSTSPLLSSAEGGYSRKELQAIHDGIVAPIGTDPDVPVFPMNSPRYPATPMNSYEIAGRRIYIKDESVNPTGSHKDRWAREMLVQHKNRINDELRKNDGEGPLHIPHLSMISSGSAAYALQSLLRHHGLPPLRVIVDNKRIDPRIIPILEAAGAKVTRYDLDLKLLSEDQVKQITENGKGVDITTRDAVDPFRERFYDWLVCEILQQKPKHIFVPFGTGDLFCNIVYTINDELEEKKLDPRLRHMTNDDLANVHVYGATTNNPRSKMDKLYAKFRPTYEKILDNLETFKNRGTLGHKSKISEVTDASAEKAVAYAHSMAINTELSGMAGLALFLEEHLANKIPKDETVVVVNTGWMYIPKTTQ